MAKKSVTETNKRRERMVKKYSAQRARLKGIIASEDTSPEDKFKARMKLAELPRNSAPSRLRNRCGISGRPRGYYRKLGMSRIALREMAGKGLVPGMTKSSW